jgi:hypothetical protein
MPEIDDYTATGEPRKKENLWAGTFIIAGGIMMVLLGSWYLMAGVAGLLNDEIIATRPGFDAAVDTQTLSWIRTIGGLVILITGIWIWMGSPIARILAIAIAAISVVFNFYSIPYDAGWSVLMLVLSLGLIWALIVQGSSYKGSAHA